MRIAILGPAFANTGYGVQIGYLTQVLQGMGHTVALFAPNLQTGAMDVGGVRVYPRLFDDMGRDMAAHARHFAADVVIPVMDIWPLQIEAWDGIKLCPWFPVDHAPVSPGIVENARRVAQPIVYSKFGQEELKKAGIQAAYIPCMVDCDVYQPLDRSEARAALGLPQDVYLIGMVAANVDTPSRKAFAQQFRAFSLFHAEHPASVLYVHTFANGGAETDGENLIAMAQRMGLEPGVDILFPDQYQYLLGYPPAAMAAVYSSFDVLMAVATGEGFCVPLIEAQACGTPVITGSWTAMPELCGAGWMVPYDDDDLIWGALLGWKVAPRVSSICECLEQAYVAEDTQRACARAFALPFDVRAVGASYWGPLLEGLQ